jgi:ribosomal protein S27E
MTYAKPVYRMTVVQKVTAEVEAEKFSLEIDKRFVEIDAGMQCEPYAAEYEGDNYAAVVRCPHCQEIQVCWGEFGDPETEVCICTQCGHNYETEPF